MRLSPLRSLPLAIFAAALGFGASLYAQEEGSASAALEAAREKARENSDLLRMAQDRFNAEMRTKPESSGTEARKPAPAPAPAPSAAAPAPAKPLIPEPVATRPAPAAAAPAAAEIPAPAAPAPTVTRAQPLLAAADVPAPKPPAPRYTPQAAPAKAGMQVTSQRSVMDDKAHRVVFSGDVVVKDTSFHMECDKLEIHLYADGEEPPAKEGGQSSSVKKAIATGGMVVIERKNEKGETEIAKSTMAVFDSVTNETVLTGGPPMLQQGSTTIEMLDPSGKIFLNENGQNRTEGRVTINMGRSPGQSKGNGLSNLNNITGSRR